MTVFYASDDGDVIEYFVQGRLDPRLSFIVLSYQSPTGPVGFCCDPVGIASLTKLLEKTWSFSRNDGRFREFSPCLIEDFWEAIAVRGADERALHEFERVNEAKDKQRLDALKIRYGREPSPSFTTELSACLNSERAGASHACVEWLCEHCKLVILVRYSERGLIVAVLGRRHETVLDAVLALRGIDQVQQVDSVSKMPNW